MANHPGTIRVLAGVTRPPLLETHEATIVEFRDQFGDLNAVFCRHFSDELWIFVTRQDPDWEATLMRLGYMNSPTTMKQLLGNLSTKG